MEVYGILILLESAGTSYLEHNRGDIGMSSEYTVNERHPHKMAYFWLKKKKVNSAVFFFFQHKHRHVGARYHQKAEIVSNSVH